jgi:hypothetical protein
MIIMETFERGRAPQYRVAVPAPQLTARGGEPLTKPAATRRGGTVRCAIYTRKSSEEGLEQESKSLQAQREACEAFIASQRHEGWACLATRYGDGGFSGATIDRPALQRLLADIAAGRRLSVSAVGRATRYSTLVAGTVALSASTLENRVLTAGAAVPLMPSQRILL